MSLLLILLFITSIAYAAGTYSNYYEISHSIKSKEISPVGSGTIYYDYNIKWWDPINKQYITISPLSTQVDAYVKIRWQRKNMGLWFYEGSSKSTKKMGTSGTSGTISWSSMPSGTYRFEATKTMQHSSFWVRDVFTVRYP